MYPRLHSRTNERDFPHQMMYVRVAYSCRGLCLNRYHHYRGPFYLRREHCSRLKSNSVAWSVVFHGAWRIEAQTCNKFFCPNDFPMSEIFIAMEQLGGMNSGILWLSLHVPSISLATRSVLIRDEFLTILISFRFLESLGSSICAVFTRSSCELLQKKRKKKNARIHQSSAEERSQWSTWYLSEAKCSMEISAFVWCEHYSPRGCNV